jgi:hypothetical protein
MNEQVSAVDLLGGTDGFGAGDAFVPVRTEEMEPTAKTLPEPPEGSTTITLDEFVGTAKGDATVPAAKAAATAATAEEPVAPAPEATTVELQMDTLVRDPADGQIKPFSQINGERAFKPEYDRVMRGRAIVDQNMPFLDAIKASTAGKVFATALEAGAPEQEALAAAAAAIGISLGGKSAKEPEDPQPVRPEMPAGAEPGSPEHSEWFLSDLRYQNELTRWESRQEVKKIAGSYEKKLDDLRKEIVADKQQESAYDAVREHNGLLYQENLLRVVPNLAQLDAGTRHAVISAVDGVFKSNGIDAEYFQKNKLSGVEVKGVFADVPEALKAIPALQAKTPPVQPTGNGRAKTPPLAPGAPSAGIRESMASPWSQQDQYSAYRGLENTNP